MPFEPYTIDDTIVSVPSGSNYVHVPEGDYLLKIVDCRPNAEDKDTAHIWVLEIAEGAAGVGKSVDFYASMHDADTVRDKKSTFFNTGNVIASALTPEAAVQVQEGFKKLQVKTYAQHVALAKRLGTSFAGKIIYGLVGDDNRNGRIYSKVVRVGPPSMFKGATVVIGPVVIGPTPNTLPPANSVTPDDAFMAAANAALDGLAVV